VAKRIGSPLVGTRLVGTRLVGMLLVATLLVATACTGSRSAARHPERSVKGADQPHPTTATPTTTATSSTAGPGATAPPPAAPATVAPRPSPGCNSETAKEVSPDVFRTALTHDGLTRTYWLQVPDGYDGTTPVPLVIDLHGFGEGAQVHLAMSGLPAYGRSHGFATVVPQGNGTPAFWNGFGAPAPAPDDVKFFGSLLDELTANLCIDTARVDVAGLSNGAFMASLLACELPGRVAAVAAVAGVQFPAPCAAAPPKSVLAIHGTADTFVGYDGGFGPGVTSLGLDPGALAGITMSPVPDIVRRWAEHDGCGASPTKQPLAADVRETRYTGCAAGNEVALVTVEGGGHAWPGSEFSARVEPAVGHTTMSVSANDLIWEFFSRHPLAG